MRSAERTLENRCEISSTERPRHRVRMLSNSSCSALASRACRLFEDDERASRLLKNALARATRHRADRELLAPLVLGAEHGLVAGGQLGQEVVEAGVQRRPRSPRRRRSAGGGPCRCSGRPAGRSAGYLEDDGHRAAQPVGVDGGRVDPVPEDAAAVVGRYSRHSSLARVVLPEAVLADQGDDLAGADLHGHVRHRGWWRSGRCAVDVLHLAVAGSRSGPGRAAGGPRHRAPWPGTR